MICCTGYILHLLDCIFLLLSCIGVLRRLHVKYSERRRQGSGDEPALSLWRAVFLEWAHFYQPWLKIHRGSRENLMFAGLLQHSERNSSALWLQHKNTRLSTQFRQTELHGGLGADVCSIVRTTIIGVKMSIITNGNAQKTKEEPILSWAYFRCCTFYICKYYIYKGRFIVLLSLSLCSNSLI